MLQTALAILIGSLLLVSSETQNNGNLTNKATEKYNDSIHEIPKLKAEAAFATKYKPGIKGDEKASCFGIFEIRPRRTTRIIFRPTSTPAPTIDIRLNTTTVNRTVG